MNLLYIFSLLQIFIYLIVVPAIRFYLYDINIDYKLSVVMFFLFFFIFGGCLYNKKKVRKKYSANLLNINYTKLGFFIIYCWIVLNFIISMQYGLYDRRIGTENAAELFASLPLPILISFRFFEIALPFLISVLIIKKITYSINLNENLLLILLFFSFFSLGAANSRSAFVILIITILIFIQNRVEKEKFKKIAIKSVMAAIFVLLLVQVYRLNTVELHTSDYLGAEILQRLDGLELISEVIKIHGLEFFGPNQSALFNPLISALPFLPMSAELKSIGLTTIKSVVLSDELGSNLKDYNSFIILDIYYVSGLIGICIAGFFMGLLIRIIDGNIFYTKGIIIQFCLIAASINLIFLEREFFGMLIFFVRDFVIIMAIYYTLMKKNTFNDKAAVNSGSRLG